MADHDRLDALCDRAACSDLVIGYAEALDARDWSGYRALFEDEIAIDYASIGSVADRIAADAWVERCRLLEMFDATRHRLSNILVRLEADAATVTSAIDAVHFITVGGTALAGDLCGSYRHELVRRGAGWRIAGCRLEVAGYPMGKPAFDVVFAAARARQEKRGIE